MWLFQKKIQNYDEARRYLLKTELAKTEGSVLLCWLCGKRVSLSLAQAGQDAEQLLSLVELWHLGSWDCPNLLFDLEAQRFRAVQLLFYLELFITRHCLVLISQSPQEKSL